jgi:L-asparaginase II
VVYAGGEVLAEVVRSGFVEGRHHGSLAVLDGSGALIDSVGDVSGAVFPRSSNKPMQSVGMLRSGLLVNEPADLSLISASHYGEPFHIARVRALLASGGLTESDLQTPPDWPLDVEAHEDLIRAGAAKSPVFMNCSGKHSGMLLTCVAAGWPVETYRSPDHPLQLALQAAVSDISGENVAAVGVDGCGAPVLAISLRALATGFLRLVSADPGTDERAVADAMRAHPELMSGTHADDARLMRAVPGLLAKGGAEGVVALAIPEVGALAMKIDDGAMRARMPVVIHTLAKLGVDVSGVADLAETPLLGGGQPVGAVRAAR